MKNYFKNKFSGTLSRKSFSLKFIPLYILTVSFIIPSLAKARIFLDMAIRRDELKNILPVSSHYPDFIGSMSLFILFSIFTAIALFFIFSFVIRRLKDMDKPFWLSLLLLIPYISLILILFLCFYKSKKFSIINSNNIQ